MKNKKCYKCRFREPSRIGAYLDKCGKTIDLSTGAGKHRTFFHRGTGWFSARMWGLCGKEGRFFERKEVSE